MFTVIENTPGYMPDSMDDPFEFDDYSAAVRYMNEQVEEYVEMLDSVGIESEVSYGLASSGNYAAAYVVRSGETHDLGRWFAVEAVES